MGQLGESDYLALFQGAKLMECDYTFLDQLSYEYCLPKGFTSAADFFEYLRGKVNTDSQFGSTRQADPFHNGFGGKSKFDREAALSLSQYFGGDERCLIFELPRHHGCLRWTHNRINASMMFGHGGQPDESVFKLIDELQRQKKTPDDIREPLDIVQADGKLWCMSNRRFTSLMAFQAWHHDTFVFAHCKVRPSDTDKFVSSFTTLTEGLGIDTRSGESKHIGQPIFDRGEGARFHLRGLTGRHLEDPESARPGANRGDPI